MYAGRHKRNNPKSQTREHTTIVSRTPQPPNLKPFWEALQNIRVASHAIILYLHLVIRNHTKTAPPSRTMCQSRTKTTSLSRMQPYYHCKHNTPTAKPEAILESFAKHIHVDACRSTQAEQPKSQTRSHIIIVSRTPQPPNLKPF
jgi:hypothetical protein